MNQLDAPQGDFILNRFPKRKNELLRAWDAADEYLLQSLAENELLQAGMSLLIINDTFGGLSIPLYKYHPVVTTDSFLSMQGIIENALVNNIAEDAITVIDSLQAPEKILN